MGDVATASEQTLELFYNTLWKDLRILEIRNVEGIESLYKKAVFEREIDIECATLEHLSEISGVHVPRILQRRGQELDIEYVRGSRLFNIWVELDRLPPQHQVAGGAAKEYLLRRAIDQQSRIQTGLLEIRGLSGIGMGPYPVLNKSLELFSILCEVLRIDWSRSAIAEEFEDVEREFARGCVVPFRDASPKNMVLAAPEIWLGNFDGEESRRNFIAQEFEESVSQWPGWLDRPLYDYDYGGCEFLTTPEDDPLSLLCHQLAFRWNHVNPESLLWLDGFDVDIERTALSFLVRYLRFGGRKAAYQLLHPNGHRTRFRYDDARFYFEHLMPILEYLGSELLGKYKKIFEVWDLISQHLAVARPIHDQFWRHYGFPDRNYYVDLFPY